MSDVRLVAERLLARANEKRRRKAEQRLWIVGPCADDARARQAEWRWRRAHCPRYRHALELFKAHIVLYGRSHGRYQPMRLARHQWWDQYGLVDRVIPSAIISVRCNVDGMVLGIADLDGVCPQ